MVEGSSLPDLVPPLRLLLFEVKVDSVEVLSSPNVLIIKVKVDLLSRMFISRQDSSYHQCS